MPVSNYAAYLDTLKQNQIADFQMSAAIAATNVSRLVAFYRLFVPTPATPTTSTALDNTSDCSMGPIPSATTNNLAIAAARLNTSATAGVSLTIIDLLNQSGGLNATVITEQTTNLPTAALTRHTSGDGVIVGLVIYTTVGTTATTVSIRYTNQAGTANQVSRVISFGGTGFREANRILLIPLADGDTGVRSVEGVTVTATTGTAGNFGVILFKPLTVFALESTTGSVPLDAVSSGGMVGSLASFDDTACLSAIGITPIAQAVNGAFILTEV